MFGIKLNRKTHIVDQINALGGIEQAMAMPTPATGWSDCDINHPAEVLVWIDPTRTVKRVILNVFSRKFRANSTGAASGGGATSSGGSPHHHTVSWDDHTHGIDMSSWGHSHRINQMTGGSGSAVNFINGGSGALSALDGNFYDTVFIGFVGQHATSSAGGGGATTSSDDTQHTHTVPPHTHDIVYGIYEFGYYAPVKMLLNSPTAPAYGMFGQQGSESTPFTCTGLDVSTAYNSAGGQYMLGPGTNFIYFTPQATTNNPMGLLRLYTEVMVIYQ